MNIHRFDELENRFSTRFTIFQCCDAQALSVIECNPNIRLLWYVWWWFEKKIISMAPSSFQCLRIRPNNTFFKKFHRIDENERFLFSLKAFYIISFATHHECHSVLSVFIRIHHSPTLPPDLLTIFFFRLKCFPLLSVNKSSFSHFKPYTTKMEYAVEKEEENFFFCIVVVIWELFVAIKTLQTFASIHVHIHFTVENLLHCYTCIYIHWIQTIFLHSEETESGMSFTCCIFPFQNKNTTE